MIIPNQSNVAFNYVLPDGQTIAAELDSNVVNTEILTYSIPKVKSADKTFMQEGFADLSEIYYGVFVAGNI